jgi:hypothetical protein
LGSRKIQSIDTIFEQEHFALLYNRDDQLIDSLGKFIGAAVVSGDPCLIIASSKHRVALRTFLMNKGVNIAGAEASGQCVLLDAATTLESITREGLPDRQVFEAIVGGILAKMTPPGKTARAYGEMVWQLCADNKSSSAILLEQFWNGLARRQPITLFCSFQKRFIENIGNASLVHELDCLHSATITPEASAVGMGIADKPTRIAFS